MYAVRRLVPDDHEALRTLRLRALELAPSSFGSTYEREVAFDANEWRRRLVPEANPHVAGVDADGSLVGMAAGMHDPDEDRGARLLGMWIDPHARGQGLADAMVEAVVAWAVSEGCTAIRLWVVESNAAAIGAYRRLGFTPTGQIDVRERDGITEIHMERSLP